MDRASIRVELLRIAFSRHGDDNRALDIAKTWEAWVLEADEEVPAKPKKPANPAR